MGNVTIIIEILIYCYYYAHYIYCYFLFTKGIINEIDAIFRKITDTY